MKTSGFIILFLVAYMATLLSPILVMQLEENIHKSTITKEIKSGKKDKEIQLLSIPITQESELKWEHELEFEFKGDMYDIKRKQIKNDTLYFWCYLDKKEKRLQQVHLNALHGLILGQPQPNKNSKKAPIKPQNTSRRFALTFHLFVQTQQQSLPPYCPSANQFNPKTIVPPPEFY